MVTQAAMTETEVVNLMESSTSEKEWNSNCDKVKRRCNGYPDFWYAAVIQSGVANAVRVVYGW